jgi:hypothetical protein
MKPSPITSLLRRLAQDAIPPAEVDLWPGIRQRFETRKTNPKRALPMKLSFAQHRRLVLAAVPILAVVLAAAVLLVTPQGRAWAQSAMQFFTRSESNTIPAPTSEPLVWVEQTPGAPAPSITPLPPRAPFAAECGDYRAPRCSIEQMRSKVDFTVQELASLPAGMYFVGATGGLEEAIIKYDTVDQSASLFLSEMPWTGSAEQKGFEVAPGVPVENVPVGRATGEYVKGSFGYQAGETVETWMPDTGQETLKWSDQGVYYSLIYISKSTPSGKDGLAALAESLTAAPVSANLTPLPANPNEFPTLEPNRWNARYPLTPAQASEQAGFDVWVPSKMPGSLTFIGVHYDAEQNLVRLFYLLNCGDCDNAMYLVEQPALNGEDCNLSSFVVGDNEDGTNTCHVVGTNATIETVQIGDGTGQYVKGDWVSNTITGFEWSNDEYPTQRLLWQKDGMAFFLYDGTWGELKKEDLIAVAESMLIAPAPTQSPAISATATPEIPDLKPEYPLSFAQAEEQAGFNVRTPASLPEILSFLGARYDAEHAVVTIFYLFEQALGGPNTDGLELWEQLAPNGSDCDLCGFVVGDLTATEADYPHTVVGAYATVETVQIGDIPGKYVEGIWGSADANGMRWLPDPYVKVLRWQKDGIAFELVYYGIAIDKEDMIAVAESIP